MKILMVNKFLYHRGGAETYAFELADYLRQQGHDVQFFGMEDSRNVYGNELNLNVSHVEFRGVSVRQVTYPFRIIYSREARRKIRQVLNDFQPDYVHLNNINFQLTPSILYEIHAQGIPMIQTLHDFQLVCPNHMMYREHDTTICEKCKGRRYHECVRHRCIHNSRVKSFFGAVEGWLYHRLRTYEMIDAFIAPSQFLADKMVAFGEDGRRIHTIHNFIKRDYDQMQFEKQDYFLYFGRLSIQKGIPTLLRVIRSLPEVPFLIAGGGELEEEVKQANLANLKFVGFKTGEELVKLIGEARATLLPTEWYENCPMAVLESLMVGTPVIGSRIGGIPELVDHEVDGLLFPAADEAALRQQVQRLWSQPDTAAAMAVKARQKVEAFSIDTYGDRLMNLVTPLLKNGRSNP
ncbi:glycosyltransferase family 4 protein [Anoxynatronum buryatiense]|uniref:Glycosyltransferase involved in cell wall bisynthesis n=1 Tax=Anoxynatronum buryatiense TaxID=489973 RepID=A0AA45WVQ5_9CLOT|nr:glycosyltransferase family 4 protein [Anoxynatronum buryatiense]SMP54885.1 Glycosyltransferase involved in cell wall bisynthesis [Anoxynatronum buryatiense]